jgi:hexosaminidase
VPPNAIVMSWRGAKGGVEAAHTGHDVVMAPDPDLYFDHLQSEAPDEPPGRPTLRTLADIYAFEPVPADMTRDVAAHVLGAQAELWTEHMRTEERVEHAAFPRLDALAEVLWSPKAARDWNSFVARLASEIERQRALGVHVAESAPRPAPTDALMRTSSALKPCSGKLRLRLEDDAPANGPRAVFDTDLFDPCWIFEHAPLDGIAGIAVDVGQIPYNFQLAHDITGIVPRPVPTSAQGDLLVKLDGCTGTPIATIPLDKAVANPAITTLTASWPPIAGAHDLCFVFAYRGHDPLWSIDKVRLVPAH